MKKMNCFYNTRSHEKYILAKIKEKETKKTNLLLQKIFYNGRVQERFGPIEIDKEKQPYIFVENIQGIEMSLCNNHTMST